MSLQERTPIGKNETMLLVLSGACFRQFDTVLPGASPASRRMKSYLPWASNCWHVLPFALCTRQSIPLFSGERDPTPCSCRFLSPFDNSIPL